MSELAVTRPPSRLYERDAELAAIEEALREATSGTATVILGTAGAGKTRLAAEALERARALGIAAVTASGGELERKLPYGIARQLFELPLRDTGEQERAALLDGPAALAAPALGLESTDEPPPTHDASFAVMHGLYWLAANMSAARPLLISVDDAHWADAPSLRWLIYLVRRLEGLPVTVVVAARPHEVRSTADLIEALRAEPLTRVLEPRPLSPPAVEALLEATFQERVEAEFAQACHEASGGNPFLLHELIRAVEARGIPRASESAGRIREMAPTTISRAALARLGELGKAERALARAVAVLLKGAQLRHAAALAGLDQGQAADAADRLSATAILRGRPPLEFVHPVVRQAIYESLAPARRALDHDRAARMLAEERRDVDTVATHLLLSEPAADPWVVETLAEAAGRALSHGAPDAAISFLRRALAEPPSPQQAGGVLRTLGAAEAVTNSEEAVEHLRAALALTDEALERVPIVLNLGQALVLSGRPEEAIGVYDETIAALPEAEREVILQLQAEVFVAGYVSLGAQELVAGRPLPVAAGSPSTPGERLALAVNASERAVAGEAPAAEAAQLAQRALGDGQLLREQTSDSPTFYLAANALFYCDELDAAERAYTDGADDARDRGSLRAFVMTAAWLAGIAYRTGRLAEAESLARVWFETPEHQVPIAAPLSVGFLVEVLIDRGRSDEAMELLESTGLAADLPDYVLFNILLAARGRLRLELGDVDAAIEDLAECGRREAAWKIATPGIAMWRHLLALAFADRAPDESRRLAAEELGRARAAGAPRALGVALRGAGLVGGHGRLELLREAVATLEGTRFRLEHARSLTDLGVGLRHTGHRNEAQETLRAGLDLASRCGAKPLVERAVGELRLAGARPRRERATGLEALTPAETRVARLAGNGMTNREIAQTLFITVKTVEMHLSRVYRKLEVASREQLDEALG